MHNDPGTAVALHPGSGSSLAAFMSGHQLALIMATPTLPDSS
jgi:hypothetical protein